MSNSGDIADLIEAFDRLAAEGGFVMNDDWRTVHEIAQAHEGEKLFDWAHAICHRIEGDDGNAGYWYRRAGKSRLESIADDWAALKTGLLARI